MIISVFAKQLFRRNGILGLSGATRTKYAPSNYELSDAPPTFDHIELPEQRRLTVMQKIPQYYISQKPPRLRRNEIDIHGPERVQNKLLYQQYGIIALSGGNLKYQHFEVIRNTVNRDMDLRKTFAVWRVDPPWKPVSKKSIGKRMGGGKGNCHHYVTPVRAGRIIIEVGGKVEFEEVKPYLERVAGKMPFDAWVVSHQMLVDLEKEVEELEARNMNPLTFSYVVKNNMSGCKQWIGKYDVEYEGKYL